MAVYKSAMGREEECECEGFTGSQTWTPLAPGTETSRFSLSPDLEPTPV
jgi:hypothetical protein